MKALTGFGEISVNIIYLGQHSIPTQNDLEKIKAQPSLTKTVQDIQFNSLNVFIVGLFVSNIGLMVPLQLKAVPYLKEVLSALF